MYKPDSSEKFLKILNALKFNSAFLRINTNIIKIMKIKMNFCKFFTLILLLIKNNIKEDNKYVEKINVISKIAWPEADSRIAEDNSIPLLRLSEFKCI